MNSPFEQTPSHETEEQRFGRVVSDIAKHRLDWLMDADEWVRLGMRDLEPLFEIPPNFAWTVYVTEYGPNEPKRVGVKLFGVDGLIATWEADAFDADLPESDLEQQQLIDHEMAKRWRAKRDRELREQARAVAMAEQERGFPEGAYQAEAIFDTRSGERTRVMLNSRFRVEAIDLREDVIGKIKSEIAITGLHNWDLNVTPERRVAPVMVSLKRDDTSYLTLEFQVDANGYVQGSVSETRMRGEDDDDDDGISHEKLLALARRIAPHAQETYRRAQEQAEPYTRDAIDTWKKDGVL